MKQGTLFLKQDSGRSIKINKIIIEVIVAILLLVWIHTGISKLLDWRSFSIQMIQSPIFHKHALFITFAGPILELILAALLIFKKTRQLGLIGSSILLVFFSWYIYWLMTNLPKLPCSCGGIVSFLNWPQHLALNIFLTVIAFSAAVLNRRQSNIKSKSM